MEPTEWKESAPGFPNVILVAPDNSFVLSYNPCAEINLAGTGETALIVGRKYYILNGDWREAYEKVFPDLDACMEIFRRNREECRSFWSNNEGGQ